MPRISTVLSGDVMGYFALLVLWIFFLRSSSVSFVFSFIRFGFVSAGRARERCVVYLKFSFCFGVVVCLFLFSLRIVLCYGFCCCYF